MEFLYTENLAEKIVQLILDQEPMEEWATQQQGIVKVQIMTCGPLLECTPVMIG